MSTVAVMPAERTTSGGASSIWIRTGMRWARRTQVKIGLTVPTPDCWIVRSINFGFPVEETRHHGATLGIELDLSGNPSFSRGAFERSED
jgi:hypothetical protein